MIPDELRLRIILKEVINALLASLNDIMKTWKRGSTSWVARNPIIYRELSWVKIDNFCWVNSIIILKGIRHIILAYLNNMMETWMRLARNLKIYKEFPWGLNRWFIWVQIQNHPQRIQERPLSFLECHDGDMEETEYFLDVEDLLRNSSDEDLN